jgi:predicted membrane protein
MAWDDERERMRQQVKDQVRELKEQIRDQARNGVKAGIFVGGRVRGRGRGCGTGYGGGLASGAVLVLIGLVLLLDHMGVLDAGQLLKFWPMILVIAGAINLMQSGRRAWGGVLLTLGVLFQLDQLGIAHFRWADLWPLALIFAGIFIMWGSIEARNALGRMAKGTGDPRTTLNEHVLFGGIERRVNSKQFRGGQLQAVFGGIEVDLRDAEMDGDEATLVANSVFGGIEIRVPETWYVASRGQGIFGAFTDATKYRGVEDSTNPHRKTLIVRGASVFGGVEIRN